MDIQIKAENNLQSKTELPALEMKRITKHFPGVLALDNVNFSIYPGEIHSLIGQNGAGKSTLMNILSGVYAADEGEILINGNPVTINHPSEALRLGIGTVYQELSVLCNLSVADNIFLGREAGNGFIINEKQVIQKSREILDKLGVKDVDVTQELGTLPLAQQQLVEIAKVLSHNPKILVLDEPTAALAEEETEHLFLILHNLREQGIAIIFISHRFKEIIKNCDNATIMRNGKVIKTIPLKGISEEELVELTIGERVENFFRQSKRHIEQKMPILELKEFSVGHKVENVSFCLNQGEILGITGLLGAGQNELVRGLFGILPNVHGNVLWKGRSVAIHSPAEAIKLGLCLLTENRKQEGLILDMSMRENMTLPSLAEFTKNSPFINNRQEQNTVQSFVKKLNIIARSQNAPVRSMSGGNQQKSIVARWLLRDLEVIIFIEPTRGIDVRAKADIYALVDQLAREGKSVIVVSPDAVEILGIADRILIMYQGKLTKILNKEEANEEIITAAIQGGA